MQYILPLPFTSLWGQGRGGAGGTCPLAELGGSIFSAGGQRESLPRGAAPGQLCSPGSPRCAASRSSLWSTGFHLPLSLLSMMPGNTSGTRGFCRRRTKLALQHQVPCDMERDVLSPPPFLFCLWYVLLPRDVAILNKLQRTFMTSLSRCFGSRFQARWF